MKKKQVFFLRNYKGFTGGHLKMFDYFNHISLSDYFEPKIYFSPDSVWDESNPWIDHRNHLLKEWNPHEADLLFLGGMDWYSLPLSQRKNWPKPIINLVQHVRHALPGTPLYACLSNHAIRICVSQEVTNSILATGKVNGPVFTIPNGIDFSFINANIQPNGSKEFDLLIVGIKNPNMAKELEIACKKLPITIKCLTEILPRLDFIRTMAASRITVLLPNVTEGFYLPALEAMALGTIVICPDCIGNRSFCVNGDNCIIPTYTLDGIFSAIGIVFDMNSNELKSIQNSAEATSKMHNIEIERQSFFKILTLTNKIWKQL
jgi:glycosyltransferase involved in cell wall biosynthesis